MKKVWLLALSLLMIVSLVACGGQNQGEAAPEDTTTKETTQILFNGSSTLAPVISSIALDFNEANGTWDKVDSSLPEANIAIYVSSGGSGQGVKAKSEGTTDFGMIARDVKDSDKESIEDMREYLVGIDALTLAVHPNNQLLQIKDDLTTEEIIKIFSGEYANWSDLDSSLPNEEIIVVTRDIGGGAHEVFQNKIMGDAEVKADAIQAPSMGALVTKIVENENAIGYASFGVANQNIDNISMLKVDGIEPSVENIQSGAYIIQRPLLLLGSGDLTPLQKAFIDVVLGADGQATVEKMGFIRAN